MCRCDHLLVMVSFPLKSPHVLASCPRVSDRRVLISVQVIEAGANALVAGSAVFNSPDYAAAVAGIKASKAPVA